MEQKNFKNKNFFQALKHAIDGIKYTFQNESNFKIQLIFAILVIVLGFIFKLGRIEFLILIITIAIVLFAETINTAIEIVLDLYSEKYNEKIKTAKDVASGAVWLVSIMSIIVGCILFLPKVIEILNI